MSGSLIPNSKPTDAAFSFEDYKFSEAYINLATLNEDDNLRIDFLPEGEYDPKTGEYRMILDFFASVERSTAEIVKIIKVKCVAMFKFRQPLPFDQLPAYFFSNSIAILYPYIRAFISTLTAQANYNTLVLPTFNISALGGELKEKTIVRK